MTENRLYAVFFYVYLMVMDWGALNLILGFVYLYFRTEQMAIAKKAKLVCEKHIQRAFEVMSIYQPIPREIDNERENDGKQRSREKQMVEIELETRGKYNNNNNNSENTKRKTGEEYDTDKDTDNDKCLSFLQMDALIKEIYENYIEKVRPPSFEEREELIALMNRQNEGNNQIQAKDFHWSIETGVGCSAESLAWLRKKRKKFDRVVDQYAIGSGSFGLWKRESFFRLSRSMTTKSSSRSIFIKSDQRLESERDRDIKIHRDGVGNGAEGELERESVDVTEREYSDRDEEADRIEIVRLHKALMTASLSSSSPYVGRGRQIETKQLLDRWQSQQIDKHLSSNNFEDY
jgi:hypothetical protein